MELTLNSINKYYSSFQALREINLTLRSSEITGILGANGAGKTTLLKILAGYYYPARGTITLDCSDQKHDPQSLRKCVSYLPEGVPLPNGLTARDLVKEYYALYFGEIPSEKLIDNISTDFQWEREKDKKVRQLSRGYRQRVGLSLTFLKNSDIVLLDEPFSGLDPSYVKGLRSLLKDKKEDRILLFSSHSLQEVYALCDRIIIMSKGEIKGDYHSSQFSSWEELDEMYNHLCGGIDE